MKDMVYERLIELSFAQESLIQAGELMDKLCLSQQKIEKYSYEAMNITDTVLNLTKQGKLLVNKLKDGGCEYSENPCEVGKDNLIQLLDEMNQLLSNIMASAMSDNEILHSIEYTAADQCGITEELKNSICSVDNCINHAVACAELIMAKDVFE